MSGSKVRGGCRFFLKFGGVGFSNGLILPLYYKKNYFSTNHSFLKPRLITFKKLIENSQLVDFSGGHS
jgi:hypothetical protein